ncbi:MAG: type VI secretion system baseplate subunit TssF [Alphaproteobacteria bacterium]|nr:type VI secretion system baseplate subunit TssF [Alphaproteobacteria bacterium]
MFQSARDRFLSYYNNEMRYLRNAGSIFAKQHPKIARRLELGNKESPDPHTERLLESFAFLSARLSQEIDERFPQIASALLDVIYPHLINPLPAMTIAQFQVDPTKGKLTTGYSVAKGSQLFTYAEQGVACRFQTAYPVTLWPIRISKTDIISRSHYNAESAPGKHEWFLRLTLESVGDLEFSDLDVDSLQFHIRGERVLSLAIYESLFAQTSAGVFISVDGKTAYPLPKDSLQPVGFERDDAILPLSEHTTHAYQLLQEYFHFLEKFLFFKVNHLNKIKEKVSMETNTIELLISLKNVQDLLQKDMKPDNFLLGCTPIVNLFPKTTEPQRLTKRKVSYRLVPDQRREKTTEIFSVLKVSAAVEGGEEPQTFSPYFSFDHKKVSNKDAIYWVAKRSPAELRDVPGTDIHLTFVDLEFNPALPAHHIIYAQTLCTNRFLAEQIPTGAELQIEEAVPISRIVCLEKPVPQAYSPSDGETLWRLISQLSVNHLSLTGGEEAVKVLKESLKLYAGPLHSDRHYEIENIQKLQTKKCTRRFGSEAWRGFVNGIHISLDMNVPRGGGDASFLLASVLRHYFALNVSVNSFIELSMFKTNHLDEYMRWHPLPGEKILL